MAKMMIAHEPQQANAKSPGSNSQILPADVKTAGKTAEQVKTEAKQSAQAFEASLKKETAQANIQAQSQELESNLKDGLQKEAKKEQARKIATPAPVVPNLDLQALNPKVPQVTPQSLAAQNENTVLLKGIPGGNKVPAFDQPKLDSQSPPVQSQLIEKLREQTFASSNPAMSSESFPSTGKGALMASVIPAPLQNAQATRKAGAKADLGQEFEHDFVIESLGVPGGKETAAAFYSQDDKFQKRTPVSQVSTSDYLNLRDLTKQNPNTPFASKQAESSLDLGTAIKGRNAKREGLESLSGKEAFSGTMTQHLDPSAHSKVIDAPVTEGASGRPVLSHDAIHKMTEHVSQLSQAKLDGEIKIRLRPDHLGELQMSVRTQGQNVAIEIKAQNGESKKIIEESLASLKESLANQNLSLARVDVVSQPTHAQSAADQGTQFDMSQFRQNSGQGSGREFEQGNTRSDRFFDEQEAPVNLSAIRGPRTNLRAGQGLDLIA